MLAYYTVCVNFMLRSELRINPYFPALHVPNDVSHRGDEKVGVLLASCMSPSCSDQDYLFSHFPRTCWVFLQQLEPDIVQIVILINAWVLRQILHCGW